MVEPLLVEIVAHAPTAYYHCTHCEVAWREVGVSNHVHDEQVGSSLPPDMLWEYQAVSDWVRELFSRHCDRVVVKVIDALSPEGLLKALRWGIHRYPAVIVGRQARFTGSAATVLSQSAIEVARRLAESQVTAE